MEAFITLLIDRILKIICYFTLKKTNFQAVNSF